MNFWLTALAAHASDMSSWIFIAYPAVIFSLGLFQAWAAIGLTLFMFINWSLIAPRLRKETEKYNSLTLSSYLESKFKDTTGFIRVFTAIISLIYYTIYISSGLVGLGILLNSIFGISLILGTTIGILIIIPYLFVGGYVTLAWTDFFQGIFLLLVILFVPLFLLSDMPSLPSILEKISSMNHLKPFFPDSSFSTIISIILLTCGWGLGYFGQPIILTKFMGIKNVTDMPKAKWIGVSWQILALCGATLIGVIAISYFQQSQLDPQHVFISIVLQNFSPFFAGFILCAILGATITCMDSQVLVLASNLTEDFYKRIWNKKASSKKLIFISRVNICIVAFIAYIISIFSTESIFNMVSYAWFGLGASFGPIIIFSLYTKNTNRFGAYAGILSGAIIAGIWPWINKLTSTSTPTLIPGFFISSLSIWTISKLTKSYKEKQKSLR